jgi:hypothetical protein
MWLLHGAGDNPAAVIVYSSPMAGNRPESPGNNGSPEISNAIGPQAITSRNGECWDLRVGNPLLAGSSRGRRLDPLGRSESESAAAVMAGALNAVAAVVAVMVDEVISPLQEAGCFGVGRISCAGPCLNF